VAKAEMKLVMTLLVRDEADIVDEHLRFHLEHGVDLVVATDHRSCDGTTEILRRYEREGHLHLIYENAEEWHQGVLVTRMARLAATEFGADWVINNDADEFWMPREGTLKEVLEAIPERFGAIRGLVRHFVLRPGTQEPFYERMIVRRIPTTDRASPYQPTLKVAHRADPDVVVPNGNSDALGRGLLLMRQWCPFDILHFPIRSREQMERKYLFWQPQIRRKGAGLHAEAALKAIRAGDAGGLSRRFLVDDDALAVGLAEGALTIDTRVRDALRRQTGKGMPAASSQAVADIPGLVKELDMLQATDAGVQLGERADSLDHRLTAVEAFSLFWPDRLLPRAGLRPSNRSR
jgi:hypothetical protein